MRAFFLPDTAGEIDDDGQNPVRKALRRAEARPKNLAKSMEDITASLSPREHILNFHFKLSMCTDHFGEMLFSFVCFKDKKEDKTQLPT